MLFDIVIVGSGPSGLGLAYYLTKQDVTKKILIIEKESYIGGCHHSRFEPKWTEHGPRVYLNNYVHFISLLKDINFDFYENFTKYKFSINSVFRESTLTIRELFILFTALLWLSSKYKQITMLEFCEKHQFSKSSKWFIDRVCRLSDGGEIDRYTLYQFLQVFNQNSLYNIYQPKTITERGFLLSWRNYLEANNTTFMCNTQVTKVLCDKKMLIVNHATPIVFEKLIFAIPPVQLVSILNNLEIQYAFGSQFHSFAIDTAYLEYISITFHFNHKLNLPKVYGFPKSDWGLCFIIQSDYTEIEQSGTVISCSVTMHNKSTVLNKLPNECSKKELTDEVFRQLTLAFPDLPYPSCVIQKESTYQNNKWIMNHQSFLLTRHGTLQPESKQYPEWLFTCGSHNGNSTYAITSLESALSNAFALASSFGVKLKKPKRIWSLRQTMTMGFLTFLLVSGLCLGFAS
jgi:predicted NAD/FAD-dependent oxidoreductase